MSIFDLETGFARISYSDNGEPILQLISHSTSDRPPQEIDLSGRQSLETLQQSVFDCLEALNAYENSQDMQKGD
jgi:hypothetical protein